MAHPKRQHSAQRRHKRQTHQKLIVPSFSSCSQCKKPILPHRVCPFCGYYKGKPVVEIEVKEKKKKETK